MNYLFNEVGSFSVIQFTTEFKRACDYSQLHEKDAVPSFSYSMNGFNVDAFIGRLTLFSVDANKHEAPSRPKLSR